MPATLISCQSDKLSYGNTLLPDADMLDQKLDKDKLTQVCSAVECRQQVVSRHVCLTLDLCHVGQWLAEATG